MKFTLGKYGLNYLKCKGKRSKKISCVILMSSNNYTLENMYCYLNAIEIFSFLFFPFNSFSLFHCNLPLDYIHLHFWNVSLLVVKARIQNIFPSEVFVWCKFVYTFPSHSLWFWVCRTLLAHILILAKNRKSL